MRSLSPTSSFDGAFIPLESIAQGRWHPNRMALRDMVSGGARIIGFVSEQALALVREGARVNFFRDFGSASVKGEVVVISLASEPALAFPELAAIHGGWIQAGASASGVLTPGRAIYRGEIQVREPSFPLKSRSMGTVPIESETRSLSGRFWRWLVSIAQKELRLA